MAAQRLTITLDFTQFLIAARQLGEAMQRISRAFTKHARLAPPPIPLHGFTPNLDLACLVCGVGPEECRGGRL